MSLSEPYQQTPATPAGQHTDARQAAAAFLADIEDIEQDMRQTQADIAAEQTPRIPTSHRDTSPLPAIGTTQPVTQPGRPPMSQRATDASTLMLTGSIAYAIVGGTTAGVMAVSEYADPTVCGIVFAAPALFALAVARVFKRAADASAAAPPQITQYYSGDVHQDHTQITTSTRGVIAYSRNNLPN